MKRQWRLFWVLALLLLWLFCSGTAQAETLAERLALFPDWHEKPLVQPAKGDLVYPDWFAGEWTVTTTLVDMVAPLAPKVVTPGFESNRQFLDRPITFPVRFVEAEPTGMQLFMQPLVQSFLINKPPVIVSDRAFNGMSLAKAYLGDRAVLTVKVDPNNPNRQITLFRDDRQLVSTVTARTIEAPTDDQFVTTEIFQQEFLGAPEIYFNEVENTTAYLRLSDVQPPSPSSPQSNVQFDASAQSSAQSSGSEQQPAIVADQVTAIYLSPQDPNYFEAIDPESLFGQPRPVALYRYRMEFRRARS